MSVKKTTNGVDANYKPKNFTEADLRPLQRVQTRGDGLYLVVPNTIGLYGPNSPYVLADTKSEGWNPLHLESNKYSFRKYDIIAIYDVPHPIHCLNTTKFGNLLWMSNDHPEVATKFEYEKRVALQSELVTMQEALLQASNEYDTARVKLRELTHKRDAIVEQLEA